MMALKLNEKLLSQQVIEAIPYTESEFKYIDDYNNNLIYNKYFFTILQLN